MANANAPRGFKPIKSLSGGSTQINYYKVGSASVRIFKGDLVKLKSDGTIERETSATAVGPWIGVAMRDGGAPATGGIEKFPVCDDPAAVYEVQGSTAAIALTDLNTIVKVDCSTTGDTNTGLSKNKLTATAATASNGVRIVRFVDQADNETGAHARLEVRINASQAAPGTAGV
jgi:hypothetical protein